MCRGLRWLVAALECTDAEQTMTDIEGVGNLALLTIADAVDAGRELLCDDLLDSGGKARLERLRLERAAGLARLQKRQQIGWSGQATDMGRQNAVGAELHRW